MQEDRRTFGRAGSDFLVVRRLALAQHDSTLRLHSHHAPEEPGREGDIGYSNRALIMLAAQPDLKNHGRGLDRPLIEGGRNFGKAIDLGHGQTIDRDGFRVQCQTAVGNQDLFQPMMQIRVPEQALIHLDVEARDAIRNHGIENLALAFKQPIDGFGRYSRLLRDVVDACSGIARLQKMLARGRKHDRPGVVITTDLRPSSWSFRGFLI